MISHPWFARLSLLVSLTACLAAPPAPAQEDKPGAEAAAEVERFVTGMHRGFGQLAEAAGGLTEPQKAKVAALEKSFADRVRKDPALLKKPAALKGEMLTQFREVLDAPQQKRFDDAMAGSHQRAAALSAATKLKQIGMGTIQYAQTAAGGAMPPDLGTLVAQGVIEADVVTLKPLPPDVAKKSPKERGDWANANGDFAYLAAGKASAALPFNFVVAHDKPAPDARGLNVLQADGSVQMLEGEKAKAVLAELTAGKNPPPSLK
jgi:hypothetical protein